MKFKFEFKLYDRKLNDVESKSASKDFDNEKSVNAGAEAELKTSNARYCEIFQYRYVRGNLKDKACIGRFTKDDRGEISYFGY